MTSNTCPTPSPPPTCSHVFTALCSSTPALWAEYTHHPFVRQLQHATLPRANFLLYLKQDFLFLRHYTRAWALAVVKSTTQLEMRVACQMVHALGVDEIQLHIAECGAMGVSQQELWAEEERQENMAYTRYVLDAGIAGDLVDLLAALMPCVLGYGEIGRRLADATRVADGSEYEREVQRGLAHPYGQWIDTYGGGEYQELCARVGDMFDAAVRDRLGEKYQESPRWKDVCDRFRTGVRLETAFWDMALRKSDEPV